MPNVALVETKNSSTNFKREFDNKIKFDRFQLCSDPAIKKVLKRNVDIHDVGNSALYLLSDLANGVTGEIHYVDAGYNKVGMPDPKNIS